MPPQASIVREARTPRRHLRGAPAELLFWCLLLMGSLVAVRLLDVDPALASTASTESVPALHHGVDVALFVPSR